MVPLAERGIVATHPLAPDPLGTVAAHHSFAGSLVPGGERAAPRCKSGDAGHANIFALMLASFGPGFQPSEPVMIEGEWPHCRGAAYPQSSWRLASLGPTLPEPDPGSSALAPGWRIHWRASSGCLAAPLRGVLDRVAAQFGPLTVNSTCRSRRHNARVGGAPRSYHLSGNAVDFRVRSQFGEVLAFLKRMRTVGGVSHYGNGVFHIDTGPRRTWGPNSWGRNRGRGRIRAARRRA
jgi:hypothetical protein